MKESAQALAAFVVYRDMGPGRTAEAAAKACGKSYSLLHRWCAQHRWTARVAAHDLAIADAAADRDKAARLADMEKRRQNRLSVAAALRLKGVEALTKMTAEALAEQPQAVIRMLDHADKTERLDTGEATERIDVTQLSDVELRLRIAQLERAQSPERGTSPPAGGGTGAPDR